MVSRNPRSRAIRNSCRRARSDPSTSEVAAVWRGVVTDRFFDSVQIVEDVRRTQKLQQPKACVSGQVDERDRVPADRDFDDDDANLREGRVRERRLHVALHARRDPGEQCRGRAEAAGQQPRRRCLFEQRRRTQQQKTPGVNRERPVVDRARRRGSLHRSRQPARKGQQRALARDGHDEEDGDDRRVGGGQPAVEAAPPPNRSDRLSVPATCRSRTAADSMAASLMR